MIQHKTRVQACTLFFNGVFWFWEIANACQMPLVKNNMILHINKRTPKSPKQHDIYLVWTFCWEMREVRGLMAYWWFATVTSERAPVAKASRVMRWRQELRGEASLCQVRGKRRERELWVMRENRMNLY